MRYQTLPADLFVRNRRKFTAHMQPGQAAVFFANRQLTVNADAQYNFQQDSNFFYLTGIDQEECILLLYPEAPRDELREILFVRRTNAHLQLWEGWKYSPEEATEASGVRTIRYMDSFDSIWQQVSAHCQGVYLDFNEHERRSNFTLTAAHQFAERLQRELPGHEILRAYPLLRQLRMLKEPEEIEQMRRACAITAEAFQAVLENIRPGMPEYELDGLTQYHFLKNGASGPAYTSIFGGGANACVLHYIQNHDTLQDGEMVLMDFGCRYGNYASDLSRTIPVNGKYSSRQRDVYEAVLDVQNFALSLIKPGLLFADYNQQVGARMTERLIDLQLLQADARNTLDSPQPAYKQYFPHGLSHHLGLDTHDIGDFYTPMQAGMVLTVEPGIYITEEAIGVRIENDVLITASGIDDLMADIPRTVSAVEAQMRG